jgi:hypothetical protein
LIILLKNSANKMLSIPQVIQAKGSAKTPSKTNVAYIDIKGILLILSGVPLPLVIFWMLIQATNLIVEAKRDRKNQ